MKKKTHFLFKPKRRERDLKLAFIIVLSNDSSFGTRTVQYQQVVVVVGLVDL